MNDKTNKYHPTVVSTAELDKELQLSTEQVDVGGQTFRFEVDTNDSSVTMTKLEGKAELGTVLMYQDQIKVIVEKLNDALKRFEENPPSV